MRTEKEIFDLIMNMAMSDNLIRAVLLVGSRANKAVQVDSYRDYDITCFVNDITPFYNNASWVINVFGKPLIMQMPEAMRYPIADGSFCYMMIYPDSIRIDISFKFSKYIDLGEPAVILLDKDCGNGFLPDKIVVNNAYWHVKAPSELFFASCCNNFWWCLNNVAKGIARDELPYVMHMLNDIVRPELHNMIDYFLGTQSGFNLTTGKSGKYFKKYLPRELYDKYAATYSGSEYSDIWRAVDVMCDLFHELALNVAEYFGFLYKQEDEDGMRVYLKSVKNDFCNAKL